MITCPKCGFLQPEDQFCAKCGIDMLAFQPKRKPLLHRLFVSPSFHAFIIIVCVLAVIYYIFQTEQRKIRRQRSQFAQLTETHSVESRDEVVESARSTSTPVTTSKRSRPESSIEKRNMMAADTSDSGPSSDPGTAPPLKPSFEVIFVEMKKNYLDELLESIETKMIYTTSSAGLIPQFQEVIQDGRARQFLTILQQSVEKWTSSKEYLEFSKGARDSVLEKDVGFQFHIESAFSQADALLLSLKIVMELKEYQSGEPMIATQTFQEEFEIPKGAALFFAGFLPHRPLYKDEESSFRSSFLRILGSSDFQVAF